MLEFLRAIRNKYRVYLLTNMEENYSKDDLEKIKDLLGKLVKQDIIKGKQRLMYSSTQVGHIAQIRHLAADLHIESKFIFLFIFNHIFSFLGDFQIVKSLKQFMNKFHLICPGPKNVDLKNEISDFVKANSKKILYFEDVSSYTSKIKNALSR